MKIAAIGATTDRQTDRLTDRETDRQTWAERQTDRQTNKLVVVGDIVTELQALQCSTDIVYMAQAVLQMNSWTQRQTLPDNKGRL